jgi:hypothetical protein
MSNSSVHFVQTFESVGSGKVILYIQLDKAYTTPTLFNKAVSGVERHSGPEVYVMYKDAESGVDL